MKRVSIKMALISALSSIVPSINAQAHKTQTITILPTADIHAYLNPHQELFVEKDSMVFRNKGGMAHIKTLVAQITKENPDGTLFIDGGNLIQGSGQSVRSQDQIFSAIVQAMAYDVLIPGNWEVIYGKKVMMDILQNYDTKVIASNMYHQADQSSLFSPYWVTQKNGIKIGFIAYNDPEIPIRQNPSFSEGIAFTEVLHNLENLIGTLKHKEKVDLLFLIAHIGISKQVALANNPAIKGVDFIFGNDTHEHIRKPIEGKYAKMGERLTAVTIGGHPIDIKRSYKIASCNRTGGPLHIMCRMPNTQNGQIMEYTLPDAIRDYLKVQGTVSPQLDGRAIAEDLGTQAFSQMLESGYQFQ